MRPLCQRLQHRSFNGDGRPPARHSRASLHRVTRIVLFVWWIRFPKIVPLLELFSSKGGTFQFQRRNSLVPAEELSDPHGGAKKSLGRDLLIPREEFRNSSDLWFDSSEVLFRSSEEFLVFQRAIEQFLRGGCAWSARLPRKKHPHLLSGEGADAICCGVAFARCGANSRGRAGRVSCP